MKDVWSDSWWWVLLGSITSLLTYVILDITLALKPRQVDWFIEHSRGAWKIYKGEELGHAMIYTRAYGKSIGHKHHIKDYIYRDYVLRLVELNEEQLGLPPEEWLWKDNINDRKI